MKTDDPLENAFDLLKARSRERSTCSVELEERMIKQLAKANQPRMSRVVRAVSVALLCLAVAGVSVAAAGGIRQILNWTGFVETSNGNRYQVQDGKVLDSDGNVIGHVEVADD